MLRVVIYMHMSRGKLHGNLEISPGDKNELLKQEYGKPLRKIYTDEELEPYKRKNTKINEELKKYIRRGHYKK